MRKKFCIEQAEQIFSYLLHSARNSRRKNKQFGYSIHSRDKTENFESMYLRGSWGYRAQRHIKRTSEKFCIEQEEQKFSYLLNAAQNPRRKNKQFQYSFRSRDETENFESMYLRGSWGYSGRRHIKRTRKKFCIEQVERKFSYLLHSYGKRGGKCHNFYPAFASA